MVGEYLSAVPALLLDPETGEELMYLTEDRFDDEEDLRAEFALESQASVEQLVAAPGGVAVLMDESPDTHLEGPMP